MQRGNKGKHLLRACVCFCVGVGVCVCHLPSQSVSTPSMATTHNLRHHLPSPHLSLNCGCLPYPAPASPQAALTPLSPPPLAQTPPRPRVLFSVSWLVSARHFLQTCRRRCPRLTGGWWARWWARWRALTWGATWRLPCRSLPWYCHRCLPVLTHTYTHTHPQLFCSIHARLPRPDSCQLAMRQVCLCKACVNGGCVCACVCVVCVCT